MRTDKIASYPSLLRPGWRVVLLCREGHIHVGHARPGHTPRSGLLDIHQRPDLALGHYELARASGDVFRGLPRPQVQVETQPRNLPENLPTEVA